MFKLLIPVLALFGFFQPTDTQYLHLIDKVQNSLVRISGDREITDMFGISHTGQFVCTGTAIAKDRVLTAAHCTHTDYPIYADGVQVKILKADEFTDLAVLHVLTNRPTLTFRERGVERFEPLTGIGYAYGLVRLSALAVRPFLVNQPSPFEPPDRTPPGILVQPSYIGGMSGGPVIDEDGLVVGIVQQGYEGVGYGVGTLIIRAFLLGV